MDVNSRGQPASRSPDDSDEPPALILGHSVTSLGTMRALGRRGVPSYMVTPAPTFISRSRWYRPCPGASEDHPSADELAPFLEDLPFERAVLMPCADDFVRTVASLPRTLRERFPASVAEPAAIATLQDKAHLAVLLDDLDVPHPPTTVLRGREDLERLPEEAFAHAFLKPRDSLRFFRRHRAKAFRVADKADALARFAELSVREDPELMLQEFLPGTTEDHYLLDGFVDREGRIRAIFARHRLRMWPLDFGNSSFLVSVSLEEVREAADALERIFAKVPYRGIFNAEFMRDPRDGADRLLEINLRAFMHVEYAATCGVDLPWMAYRDALGLPVEAVTEYDIGRRSVDLERDLPAAIHLISHGQLGPLAWLRSCVGADGFVFAWDDPAPGIYRLPLILGHQLRRPGRGRRKAG